MWKRRTSRRDFLKGKPAADAMADRLDQLAPGDSDEGGSVPRDETYLVEVSRAAMACRFEVFLNAGQYEHGTQAALEALDRVDALEDQLSIFRETSEISRINREAAAGPVEVEPGLFGLLELAVRLHAETGGALDITATALWDVWGFSRRQGRIPTEEELATARQKVGSEHVELDARAKTVRFTKPCIRLSLGSIGKGYALDRSAERMLEHGVGDFMIHGGQSSVLARGSAAGTPAGGWLVGLHHPLRHRERLAEIRLGDRALATSSSEKQFFRYRGRRLSHILDPRTGQPAEGLLSVTVLAPTAALADGLSTAFFVMGAEATIAYCESRPELGALLVRPDRGSRVEVLSLGLEAGDVRIAGV